MKKITVDYGLAEYIFYSNERAIHVVCTPPPLLHKGGGGGGGVIII